MSQEHGKTLDDAKGSVTRGLEVVDLLATFHLLKVNFPKMLVPILIHGLRQPLGVTAGILPFNFQPMVPMGCILSPSPVVTHSYSNLLRKILRSLRLSVSEAGLPDGVFNVINGDKTQLILYCPTKEYIP